MHSHSRSVGLSVVLAAIKGHSETAPAVSAPGAKKPTSFMGIPLSMWGNPEDLNASMDHLILKKRNKSLGIHTTAATSGDSIQDELNASMDSLLAKIGLIPKQRE